MNKLLIEKIKEALIAILPLSIVVMAVLLFFKVESNILINYSIGVFLLIAGLVIFSIGSNSSMMFLSEEIGSFITKKRKLWFFILIGFLIGFLITISEPSVWVLGEQFKSTVPLMTMVIMIALGSSIFIVIALLRILLKLPLNIVFIIIFAVLFTLAFFMPAEFVPVAFDSGGFSTGPMAVPFLVSLGFGVVSTTGESNDQSFGLLGITSIGPIFSVLILGLFFDPVYTQIINTDSTFINYLLEYMFKVAIAIVPFIIFFIVFQITAFKYPKRRIIRIATGFALTYTGLVLFLTGAAMGFMQVGPFLGEKIASFDRQWLLIIFGFVFAMVMVLAEPSVVVLVNQVQEATDGSISKTIMLATISLGVSLAIALAMTRIVYNISIWWFLLPGYLIVMILSFFTPKMFTGIALDSGGAASGALASTFLVPFAIGAATVIYPGQDALILRNAFGVMAFIVMAPLITIQVLGLIYKLKSRVKTTEVKEDEVIELSEDF